jgi:uncharacterized protein (DUF362 family)
MSKLIKPPITDRSQIALRALGGRRANLEQVLQDIDDRIEWGRFNRIVIKPNFVSTTVQLASTHVETVMVLVNHIRKRFNGEIWLIEGGAGYNRFCGFTNFGYEQLICKSNVILQEIGEGETVELDVFNNKLRPIQINIDKRMLESDFVISITPPKVHDTVVFTGTLKNVIMGSLVIDRVGIYRRNRGNLRKIKRWLRNQWDSWWPIMIRNLPTFVRKTKFFNDIDFWLLRTFSDSDSRMKMHQSFSVMNLNLFLVACYLRPHLGIIDGFLGMEGDGPVDGTPVKLDFAIAGTDCVAVDATAARIMGINPELVGYLYYCDKWGLGCIKESGIELIGRTSFNDLIKPVGLHPTYVQQIRWRSNQVEELIESLDLLDYALIRRK